MAALKYRDEHNKVGFLEKPKGSADYHQVLDFLRGSHIRYAITHDPIIYDSLVKQFWSTASLRASEEGPPAILATIDRTPYTITESLVRSQLQLDDDGGVEDLPIADIYLGESSGEDAPSNPQDVPATITEPDHSHDHESTPPRPTIYFCCYSPISINSLMMSFAGGSAILLVLLWFSADLPTRVNFSFVGRRLNLLIANKRRREFAAQRFQDKMNKPMTYAQQKAYMRTFVKNQSSTIYTTGWTMKHVKSFSELKFTQTDSLTKLEQLVQNYNLKPSEGLLKDLVQIWNKLVQRSPNQLKLQSLLFLLTHGVPQEEAGATPSQNVSQEEVAAPSPSQDIPDAQVEVPSNTASTAQHAASSLKKVGTRKKRLGRKGVHTSHSTIHIEDGDPEAEHKMCIKYASDADSASDDDTPVNLYAVVDWELVPTGLGLINVFYRKDNSRKYFTSLREILHLVTRADLMTIYGRVMTFYQDKKAAGIGLVLWGDLKVLMDSPEVNDGSDVWKNQQTWKIQSWKLYSYSGVHVLETVSGLVVHMFVDKKYPLSVNLIERMLDHQLEICHGSVGNELTTAVQLIAFLKKQISDSRRPKVHDCCGGLHVAVKEYAFGFKMLMFNPLVLSKTDLSRNLKYVVPTGRVKVPAGRYVVPTGKDNVIVSAGRTKVIPAGSTILVLVVLCLLRVDSKVS
ncbi:hypothetical protein Tco_0748347 [Tanacetum coccineum]|uniref:Uncharacterized protein n=1 Tax=Tanacetum coccineum TaxID=301880 RepID=A0ABQ4YWK4_9ASTR